MTTLRPHIRMFKALDPDIELIMLTRMKKKVGQSRVGCRSR